MYLRHATNYSNTSLLRKLRNKDTRWIKVIYKYIECTGITLKFIIIINSSRGELISAINRWVQDRWLSNKLTKSTLTVYISMKQHIKEEKWFKNGAKYSLMMKARSDALKLGWRNWATDEEKICKLCGHEIETNKRFLL